MIVDNAYGFSTARFTRLRFSLNKKNFLSYIKSIRQEFRNIIV